MPTNQLCLTPTFHPTWTSYSPTNIPNAIIISKLILFHGFIIENVLREQQVINNLNRVVSIDAYKPHSNAFFSTIPNNLNQSDITSVSTYVEQSFRTCVNNIKRQPTENSFPTKDQLLKILSNFRNAMTNPSIVQSFYYFSELDAVSKIFLSQNNPFHSSSSINDIQQNLGKLDATTLNAYLSICPLPNINLLTIQSILFGSLFLAAAMKPPISEPKPRRRTLFGLGGNKHSRRRRKQKRQRNITTRQNK